MPLRNQPLHQVTVNWVQEVITFANLENPNDILIPNRLGTADDEKNRNVIDAQGSLVEPEDWSFIDLLYNFIGGSAPDGYGASQARLREVLNTLTADSEISEVHQLIAERIASLHVPGELTYRDGSLRYQPVVHFHSFDQWWAVGIAILLQAGLGDRVQQCGWNRCATYFVDWPGRKGQKKLYCNPDHQNAEGQQRSRDIANHKLKLKKANQSMGY